MGKNDLINLFDSGPEVQPNEVKLNRAQNWLVYSCLTLFVPFAWACNHYPWARLVLLICVPTLVLASFVARYYQYLAATWMQRILILTFAVHSLLILVAVTLWRMSSALRRNPELDILAGVVCVLVEIPILIPVFRRYWPREARP
jgi:hypothetical protein